MEWMILPLKRYFDFRGRSQRKEFWLWVLFVFVVAMILSIVDRALGLGGSGTTVTAGPTPNSFATGFNAGMRTNGGLLTGIFALAVLIPNIAVAVRRLHDTDRTGWWILLPALPYFVGALLIGVGAASRSGGSMAIGGLLLVVGLICAIALIVFYCLDGTPGPNRFGPDPKGQDLTETFS